MSEREKRARMSAWKITRAALLASTAVCALVSEPAEAGNGFVSYSYDSLGRVVTANYDNGVFIQYSYDALGRLSREDRKLADQQRFCAVQDGIRLGSMGTPVKVMLNGKPVLLCCEGCKSRANSRPNRTLAKAADMGHSAADGGSAWKTSADSLTTACHAAA